MEVRDKYAGVTVTMDRTAGPIRQGLLKRSSTDPALTSYPKSPLPPAVALVDSKGYVHSKKVNNYLVGGTLGEGSFAKVKESFHVLVGEKVAMKIIDKKKALQDAYVAKNFKREAKLLQKVCHPNIIQLYEVIETENNYYLITELCSGGELMKYIYKMGRLSETETRKYVRQIVSAIDHLHKAGIIHRDLKVENLLLDHNKDVKLIDFGLSNEEYTVDESGKEIHCKTQCGSPAYAAPELLGQKQYGKAADIWSIGVNMYAMLTGCLPFTVEPFNITALHAKMLQNKINPIPEHITKSCKDLLKKLLVASPDDRITMPEIFSHPWLSEDLTIPFQPAPYPNLLKHADINQDIVDHMVNVLHAGNTADIKADLVVNRATSLYAIYYLLLARLARYEREFPTKQIITKVVSKKKLSKDQGFYDEDDDNDAISTVTAPSRLQSRGGNRKNLGVNLRQKKSQLLPRSRPTSEDFTTEKTPQSTLNRRLSNITEERRGSVPEGMLKKQLEALQERNRYPLRKSKTMTNRTSISKRYNPQPNHPPPPSKMTHQLMIDDMSPPSDPYEFDLSNHTPHFLQKRHLYHSLPRQLNLEPSFTQQAWNSNSSSRASSRNSSFATMPPIRNRGSLLMDEDDDLEFHDVTNQSPGSTNGAPTFFIETPPPLLNSTDNPLTTPDVRLPSLPVPKKSPRRRNGFTLPPTGDFVTKTDLQVGAIISEILRTAHNMHMKSAEPQLANSLKCEHKCVHFEIGVRKNSLTSCILHFEWLSGGSLRQFNDVCQEVLHKIHL